MADVETAADGAAAGSGNSSSGELNGRDHTQAIATAQANLAEHASAIRALGKRVVLDIIEIGQRLSECKELLGHGNWLPWLEREFGWTERTAQRFMSVHSLAGKYDTVSDLDLPVGALYLLAAPSTPDEARTEIIERLEAGEHLPVTEVKRVIEATKAREQPAKKRATVGSRKNEALANFVSSVATVCDAVLERGIRHLDNTQRDEMLAGIGEAIDSLEKLQNRINIERMPELMPTAEEADQSWQATLLDQALLLVERMTDETRQRFFAHIKKKYEAGADDPFAIPPCLDRRRGRT